MPRSAVGNCSVGIDVVVAVDVQVPVLAVEGADLIARSPDPLRRRRYPAALLLKLPATGIALTWNAIVPHGIADAIVGGVPKEPIGPRDDAVDTKLVEPASRRARRREVAGEVGVAAQSKGVSEVPVGRIIVLAFGIPDEVAVDVGVHGALRPGCDFRSAVHGEPSDKVTAGDSITAWEQRNRRWLRSVVLAVQLVSDRIDHAVGDS